MTAEGAANQVIGVQFFIVSQTLNLQLSVANDAIGVIAAGLSSYNYVLSLGAGSSYFSSTEKAVLNDYLYNVDQSVYRPLLDMLRSDLGIASFVPKTDYRVVDLTVNYPGIIFADPRKWTIADDAKVVVVNGQKKLQVAAWAYTQEAGGKQLPTITLQYISNGSVQTLAPANGMWGVQNGIAQNNNLYGPKCSYSLEIPLPNNTDFPDEVQINWHFSEASYIYQRGLYSFPRLQVQSANLSGHYLNASADYMRQVSIPVTLSSALAVQGITFSLTALNTTNNPPIVATNLQFQFTGFPTSLTPGQPVTGSLDLTFPTNLPTGTYAGLLEIDAPNAAPVSLSVQVTVPPLGDTPYTFTTLAGMSNSSVGSADGMGSAARFYSPVGVAVDSAGNVYVADTYNHTIRKVTPAGLVTTLAGSAGWRGGADGTGSGARFYGPTGVAVDSAGNVYVADAGNNEIRKVTPAGVVTTLAGNTVSSGSADGTGSAARFYQPTGVAVDSAGNVYVADARNNTVRKVTSAGVVTTLVGSAGSSGSVDGTGSAARFYQPTGVAVDSAGNVYVADAGNNTIRKVMPAGVVTTLAGSAGWDGGADGTSSVARFYGPAGVAVDSAGNVYVADRENNTIRKVAPAGVVTTLAGSAWAGSADGTGAAAQFYLPYGVAVDSAENIYVADTYNHTIRKVTAAGMGTTLAGSAGGAAVQMALAAPLSSIIHTVWRRTAQGMSMWRTATTTRFGK